MASRHTILVTLLLLGTVTQSVAETVLFQQPRDVDLLRSFCVRCSTPPGRFAIVQWEDNPFSGNGKDVPVSVDLGSSTGLAISDHNASRQLGLRNAPGTSGVMVDSAAVGVFISSEDLPNGSPQSKFIIAPGIEFSPQPMVFGDGNTKSLHVSFDLQVPVAESLGKPFSAAYVVSDLMFVNRKTGNTFYINSIAFKYRTAAPADDVFFDVPTNTPAAVGSLSLGTKFSKQLRPSTSFQNQPWVGWRHFAYDIDETTFRIALATAARKVPSAGLQSLPPVWNLKHWHLNAEILFKDGPAKLGWSIRNVTITAS